MAGVTIPPLCLYCHVPAVLRPWHLWHPKPRTVMVWECPTPTCDARVGTHANSKLHRPLGTLARAPLRAKRTACHALFDPLWRGRPPWFPHRRDAYAWLAGALGIPVERCHFGEFDESACDRATAAIRNLLDETPP